MTSRVLLIQIDAMQPGARVYTTWNASDKTAGCALSGSNLIASATATANYNGVRSVQVLSSGQWYWETALAFASGTGYVLAAGIARTGFAIGSTQLGTDGAGNSAAGPGQDGQVRYKGAVTGDAGTVATGNVVRHHLDLDAGTYRVAIAGGAWVIVATGLSGSWYPCAQFTVSGHAITANFGATAFVYAVPDGASSGVWAVSASTPATKYLASETVITLPTATPANTLYLARLMRNADPKLTRRVSCWPWGGDASATLIGDLVFANRDRGLDSWRGLEFRNALVTLRYGTAKQCRIDPSACAIWAQGIAERVDFGADTVSLVMADVLAQLDRPLQSSVYDSATPNVLLRERPKPVTLGRCMHIDPPQTDSVNRRYDLHDDPDHVIVDVFDQADPFTQQIDFTRYGNGFALTNVPAGKVTATAIGESILGAEVIGADGDFTSWVAATWSTNPSGWTVTGETSAIVGVHESPAGSAQLRNTGGGGTVLLGKAGVLTPGQTYFCDVVVSAYVSGTLRVSSATAANTLGTEHGAISAAGTHRITITPGASETALVLHVNSASNSNVSINSVDVYPVQPVQYLPQWIEHLVVTRGELDVGDIDSASVSALDAKAHYASAYHTRDATTIRDVLRMTMTGYTGWISVDRLGQITAGRLEAPATTPHLSLTERGLYDEIRVKPDDAPALSTMMGAARTWSQFSDSDFVTAVQPDVREKLKAKFQEIRRAVGVVHPYYKHADKATIVETLLQSGADAAAEVNRVATLYAEQRAFYSIPAMLDVSAALTLRPGNTLRVTAPRLDLASGKSLLAVGIEQSFFSQRVTIEGWG
ncbi:hypothetical protein C7S18_12130 [Ahniella affigens]|uniref:B30.2/SPRY domain-containing protein n=1 Tax=Ahniella affigens TaxID=2021234 RepID=A0A2P1PSS3_9GAMM|nr:hypothetical protein [Ahniella affigens]AVP97899.1 hypothetical protein C7S18_12130 [Ahniella affigens]